MFWGRYMTGYSGEYKEDADVSTNLSPPFIPLLDVLVFRALDLPVSSGACKRNPERKR